MDRETQQTEDPPLPTRPRGQPSVVVQTIQALTAAGAAVFLLWWWPWNLKGPAKWLAMATISYLSLLAVFHPTRLGMRIHYVRANERFREWARVTLNAALLAVSRETGIKIEHLGMSAFLILRRIYFPWQKYLLRLASVRLSARIGSSRILWTKGKGVIGLSWQLGSIVTMNSKDAYAPYMDATEAQWKTVPDEVRLGLTLSEFERIKGKYAGVIAVPIRGEAGRVHGVVSLDLDYDASNPRFYDDRVLRILVDAASTIADGLPFLKGWIYR